MTQRGRSGIDVALFERMLFTPDLTEAEYQRRRAVMTRFDRWRFRRSARFLTRIARKMQADQ